MADKVDSIAKIVYEVAMQGFSQYPQFWPSWEDCPDSPAKKAALMAAIKIDCLGRASDQPVGPGVVDLEKALCDFRADRKVWICFRDGRKEEVEEFYVTKPLPSYPQHIYKINDLTYTVNGSFSKETNSYDIVCVVVDDRPDLGFNLTDSTPTAVVENKAEKESIPAVDLEAALQHFNNGARITLYFDGTEKQIVESFENLPGLPEYKDFVYWIDGRSHRKDGKYDHEKSIYDIVAVKAEYHEDPAKTNSLECAMSKMGELVVFLRNVLALLIVAMTIAILISPAN